MKRVFVDANVFLRFFTTDDEGQHRRASGLLRKAAAGKIEIITAPPVLFEIAWTLRAAYNLSNERVLDVLARMVALPGLVMTDADVVEEAILLAGRSGQEFADAYVVASAGRAGVEEIATFNRKHFESLGATLHSF